MAGRDVNVDGVDLRGLRAICLGCAWLAIACDPVPESTDSATAAADRSSSNGEPADAYFVRDSNASFDIGPERDGPETGDTNDDAGLSDTAVADSRPGLRDISSLDGETHDATAFDGETRDAIPRDGAAHDAVPFDSEAHDIVLFDGVSLDAGHTIPDATVHDSAGDRPRDDVAAADAVIHAVPDASAVADDRSLPDNGPPAGDMAQPDAGQAEDGLLADMPVPPDADLARDAAEPPPDPEPGAAGVCELRRFEDGGWRNVDAPDGSACDDGDATTADDACRAGVCGGQQDPRHVVSFIPDTGQTACFDEEDSTPCPAVDAALFGQDAFFQGPSLDYEIVGDGAVRDRVTGLLWTTRLVPERVSARVASRTCDELNAAERDDWRLPNRRELATLVDYGVAAGQGPLIDPRLGPTRAAPYWTTDDAGDNPDRAMRVSVRDGTSRSQDKAVDDGYARCVSGDVDVSEPRLLPVDRDRGVYDPTTGLLWQRVPGRNQPWSSALEHCARLETERDAEWRLPNVRELATLLAAGRATPAVDVEVFWRVRAGDAFWTSTTATDPVRSDHAFIIGLGDLGTFGLAQKREQHQTLCVRSCPCRDARCCDVCEPRPDDASCDDDDPATFQDRCLAGRCRGVDLPAPPEPRAPPFDCRRLDCGRRGVCVVRDGDEEVCLCDPHWVFNGNECVEREDPEPLDLAPCVPYDTGVSEVCIVGAAPTVLGGEIARVQAPPGGGGAAPPRGGRGAPPGGGRGAEEERSHYIDFPGRFQLHGQHGSQFCSMHAVNTATELLMASRYQPLSEAHVFDVAGLAFHPCEPYDGDLIRDRLVFGQIASGTHLVSDRTWDIDYRGAACDDIHRHERPAPEALTAQGVAHLDGAVVVRTVEQMKTQLRAGRPVIVGIPIVGEDWRTWLPNVWNVVTEAPFDRVRAVACQRRFGYQGNLSTCHCEADEVPGRDIACPGSDPICYHNVCTRGFHVVTLVGFDDDDSGGRFLFLNSWASPNGTWGHRAAPLTDGPGSGFGKMSYGFVQRFAGLAIAMTQVELACADPERTCRIGDVACNGDRPVWCREVAGCHEWTGAEPCGPHADCVAGEGCVPDFERGDRVCEPGENCLNSPADCACPCDAVCTAEGECDPVCDHECAVGTGGCIDASTRWRCEVGDQDCCRERVEVNCLPDDRCNNGRCVPACAPFERIGCHQDDVWWFDSCDEPHAAHTDCPDAAPCDDGACGIVCEPNAYVDCNGGDLYSFDSCDRPRGRAEPCGESSDGAPYCHGGDVHRDRDVRGCEDAACHERRQRVLVRACEEGCRAGVCIEPVARCGDGVCDPGEGCASCAPDCACRGAEPFCDAENDRCVGCTEHPQCPLGFNCEAGRCQGCDACGPERAYRCDGSDRLHCSRLFQCLHWIHSDCGWGQVCCDGGCSSETPPASPTPQQPAPDARMRGPVVRFEWENRPAGHRITLAICESERLGGRCIIREPQPGWWYLDVEVPSGRWYWAVRGITDCDASPWGDYSNPIRIDVE